MYYDISHEPNSHDSLAWGGTKLGASINEILPSPYFLNGDNAYIQDRHMVVPIKDDDDFNFYQSSIEWQLNAPSVFSSGESNENTRQPGFSIV
jgi:hypothetical protein